MISERCNVKNNKFKATYAKNATRTPDNVKMMEMKELSVSNGA